MGMSEREHHIKVLEQFLHDYQSWGEDLELDKAIKYAITSLKTDLKYDLLYEGEDVYTKSDMVAMLEDLDLQIDESATYNLKVAKVQRLIRNKIDKLKREDLPHCQYTDEEIAKSFIGDVEAVKDQLPTTKNDLEVDCVARHDVERFIEGFINEYTPEEELEFINLELDGLKHLPPATPQEPRRGHWIDKQHLLSMCSAECSECKKRASGYIVDNGFSLEYKFYDYCPNCGADMREVEE